MEKFSLIIPVYKQEKTIKQNIQSIQKSLQSLNRSYELIIVIDGMLDNSFNEAQKAINPNTSVIGYKTNHGKGYAVKYGFAHAKSEVIAFMDGGNDLSMYPFSMMLDEFEWQKADIVIGSKLHPDSKVAYPFFRKILSWGYRIITRLMFGLNVRDTQVGMKIFRKKVLEDVLPRLLVKQFAFDIEMLAVAYHLGYHKIYEAPVEINFNGASSITSFNFWNVILRMLWDTFAVFYRLKIIHYYDDGNKRKWKFDPELNFRVNIG